jgi:hypothetical protein
VPRLRMCGAIPLLLQYVFMASYSVKHKDNFKRSYINSYSCCSRTCYYSVVIISHNFAETYPSVTCICRAWLSLLISGTDVISKFTWANCVSLKQRQFVRFCFLECLLHIAAHTMAELKGAGCRAGWCCGWRYPVQIPNVFLGPGECQWYLKIHSARIVIYPSQTTLCNFAADAASLTYLRPTLVAELCSELLP